MDINTNWPVDTWSITEPSGGYQCEYIRLLSKFVSVVDPNCAYPSLGADTSICGRPSITLNTNLTATGKTFKWYKEGVLINGASSNTYSATSAGTYMVEVDANGCKKTDELKVTGTLSVYLGADLILCSATSATIDAGNDAIPNVQYLWNTKETTQKIITTKAGTYSVSVSAQNCPAAKDTVVVTSKLLAIADVAICPTQTATLSTSGASAYEWYAASTGGTALATSKTYTVTPAQTTVYYAQDPVGTLYKMGKTDSLAGEAWTMSGEYLAGTDKLMNFSALQPITVQSLVVYLASAGDVTVNFVSGATVVRTKTITGLSIGKQTINLNLDIPTGNYILNLSGSTASFRFSAANAAFPYTVAGVASMTYNESWQSTWYGYYYDIKLSTGTSCARTPVTVTVKDTCAKPVTQSITLATGWNLISTNVHPADSSIVTLFTGLNVIEIKTMDGFWRTGQPAFLSPLQAITAGEGYMVNMKIGGKLSVTGAPISLSNYQLNQSSNLQLAGCPYQTATPMAGVLGSKFSWVKNFEGFRIPNNTQSNLDSFEPGKGYYIKK